MTGRIRNVPVVARRADAPWACVPGWWNDRRACRGGTKLGRTHCGQGTLETADRRAGSAENNDIGQLHSQSASPIKRPSSLHNFVDAASPAAARYNSRTGLTTLAAMINLIFRQRLLVTLS